MGKNVIATVLQIVPADRNGVERILLGNIHIEDEFFRDHSWIVGTKRTKVLNEGDVFEACAEVYNYDYDSKAGLKKFRSIKVQN